MRVMAIDYGSKSIGLAISDELRLVVRPLATIRRDGGGSSAVLGRIAGYVLEYEVGTLVVGMPLSMDGTRGTAARRVERFIDGLRPAITIPIVTVDERLTSREADDRLRARGMSERERRRRSDEYAAVIMLEDYLAACEMEEAKRATWSEMS